MCYDLSWDSDYHGHGESLKSFNVFEYGKIIPVSLQSIK